MPIFLQFVMVGGAGFLVDALFFTVLSYSGALSILNARAVAFCAAATFTWLGNRWFTFKDARKCRPLYQYFRHMLSVSVGLVISLACFSLILHLTGVIPLAFVLSVLSSMFCNYALLQRFVFTGR